MTLTLTRIYWVQRIIIKMAGPYDAKDNEKEGLAPGGKENYQSNLGHTQLTTDPRLPTITTLLIDTTL